VRYRAACALALFVYAVVVLVGALSGHLSPDPLSQLDVPRAVAALVLAAGVFLRVRRIDVLAAPYILWLGTWGLFAIFGPLYQFLVPFGGQSILPDQVRAGVAVSSELALFAAAIALLRRDDDLRARSRRTTRPHL
jgi:peptidoglycan/LPS O-acetylase OafA/YrhL